MTPAQQELRDLIRARLADGMTADQAADAAASLFYDVADEWESIDMSAMDHGPGTFYIDQRGLVAKVRSNDARERSLIPKRTARP